MEALQLTNLERLMAMTPGRPEVVVALIDGPVYRVDLMMLGALAAALPSGSVEPGTGWSADSDVLGTGSSIGGIRMCGPQLPPA